MGVQAMSAIALRPYLPADAARCAEIFRASVEETASEDYSADQCDAWAAQAPTTGRPSPRASASALTLVALIDGEAGGLRQPARRGRHRHALCRSSLRPTRRRRRADRRPGAARRGARRRSA